MFRTVKLCIAAALTASIALPLSAAPAHASTGLVTGVVKGVVGTVDGAVNGVTDAADETANSVFADDPAVHGRAAVDDPGSLYGTDRMINADKLWSKGITGSGIDVAVLDSGVSPVPG